MSRYFLTVVQQLLNILNSATASVRLSGAFVAVFSSAVAVVSSAVTIVSGSRSGSASGSGGGSNDTCRGSSTDTPTSNLSGSRTLPVSYTHLTLPTKA